MPDKPRARADADVLPSPTGGQDPQQEDGKDTWLGRFFQQQPPPHAHNRTALTCIAALRDCAGWLSSQSGAGRQIMWDNAMVNGTLQAGLNQLTRQGFENGPDALPLRHLLNVASYLDNMHLNYVQPTLMRLEEQLLHQPSTNAQAARDVYVFGSKWLKTAHETLADIRNSLTGCYEALGVPDAQSIEANHPLRRVAIESELTYNRLLTALELAAAPMKELEAELAAQPATGKSR